MISFSKDNSKKNVFKSMKMLLQKEIEPIKICIAVCTMHFGLVPLAN